MKITISRDSRGLAEISLDDEALQAPREEYEKLLMDAQTLIASALLDIQPSLTSEDGWQGND